jgi:hypothetical protein
MGWKTGLVVVVPHANFWVGDDKKMGGMVNSTHIPFLAQLPGIGDRLYNAPQRRRMRSNAM